MLVSKFSRNVFFHRKLLLGEKRSHKTMGFVKIAIKVLLLGYDERKFNLKI